MFVQVARPSEPLAARWRPGRARMKRASEAGPKPPFAETGESVLTAQPRHEPPGPDRDDPDHPAGRLDKLGLHTIQGHRRQWLPTQAPVILTRPCRPERRSARNLLYRAAGSGEWTSIVAAISWRRSAATGIGSRVLPRGRRRSPPRALVGFFRRIQHLHAPQLKDLPQEQRICRIGIFEDEASPFEALDKIDLHAGQQRLRKRIDKDPHVVASVDDGVPVTTLRIEPDLYL